jgi:hypothetical protein
MRMNADFAQAFARIRNTAGSPAPLYRTISWMHVELLVVQEILPTPDAQTVLPTLRADLDRLTGDIWQVDLQSCRALSSQHAGFLWNGAGGAEIACGCDNIVSLAQGRDGQSRTVTSSTGVCTFTVRGDDVGVFGVSRP